VTAAASAHERMGFDMNPDGAALDGSTREDS
jgi:hypothetical protein